MWVERLTWADEGHSKHLTGTFSRSPQLVFCFGTLASLTSGSPYLSAIADLKNKYPDCLIMGCSTGAFIDKTELGDEGMSAIMVGFEKTRLRAASRQIDSFPDNRELGLALANDLAEPDLAAIFVLADGLNLQGSALLRGINEVFSGKVVVTGGMAGDGVDFAQTRVLLGDDSVERTVVAIGFYGHSIRVSSGSAGGWAAFGPERIVTRGEDNTLFTLDGVPALDVYERYLGEEAAMLPASALLYPLMIWDPAKPDKTVIRTVLGINREARTMTFAGDMPTGWRARLMQGRAQSLIDGAADAAYAAIANPASADTAHASRLCLMVSCIGRQLALGQRTSEEIASVANVLGEGTVLAGFYSNGEFSPPKSGDECHLHNQTVTLTLLSETA
ncbi:FIST N-terminal domain-containing protein [Rhizobium sp. FKY42]|uniref:FIST signal transduction protein n=1 Tax=Rhizobium sp. FKY42 TaxID=2562310 RepID=UPI0010C10167|nr:FIST N-terminal domain-containing protein [Rhizobium sp. FKY42]